MPPAANDNNRVGPSPAYWRGYHAGLGCGDGDGCPFPLGTLRASEWEEGYWDAKADVAAGTVA